MAERKPNTFQSQNRTDSMVGASMRIDGNVAFTGVLRIQGSVVGDIICDEDPHGTIVTDVSGNVTGSIKSPCIVVKGKLTGPSHVAESIQIQHEGRIAGDLIYKEIEILKGGVIEGQLTSLQPQSSAQSHLGGHHAEPTAPASRTTGVDLARTAATTPGKAGKLVLLGAALLAAIGLMLYWVYPFNPADKLPGINVAMNSDPSRDNPESTPPAPAGSSTSPISPGKETNSETGTAATGAASKEGPAEAQDTALKNGAGEPEPITSVQGVNPRKPDDFFLIIAKEPAALLRKKRGETADGSRLEVPQGKKISITIGKDDIFRVIKGRNMEILFQGKKVGPKTIESGAWISFTPHPEHR